jgi:CRP-like cAMP-binding protein
MQQHPDTDAASPLENDCAFVSGQILFREGESGDALYIVAEGQVDIQANGQLLETLGPGDILGEMALIDDQPRMATAIARTDCLLTRVSRAHFLTLVQRNPRFALQVMRIMAHRLRRAIPHLSRSASS